MASADFSGGIPETSRDKSYIFFYHLLACLRILRLRLPLGTSLSLASLSAQDVPSYQVSVRRATISLLLLLSRFLCGTCKSLWGSSATTPLEWTFTTDV